MVLPDGRASHTGGGGASPSASSMGVVTRPPPSTMMSFRLGYVANCLSLGLTASHTCRLSNATPRELDHLIAQNLSELEEIFLFNEAQGIEVFRIGSSLIPFASHPVNRTRWWKTFARDFDHLGRIATRSRQRLSMHPGPEAASLASVRPSVRKASVRELIYATRVLDLLGQDNHGRIVLHVGGAAPDRPTAMRNAHAFLDRMPNDARRRLVIEHDDYIWSAREVLPLARDHGLPLLADTLHNAILPSDPPLSNEDLLAMASQTWLALGLRPKHHLATQRRSARLGAHSRRISGKMALRAITAMRHDADLMLEAKDKDLALLQLRRELAASGVTETLRAREQQDREPLVEPAELTT